MTQPALHRGEDTDAGGGRRFAVVARGEDSAGIVGAVDFTHPPGDRVSAHVHRGSDEFFYVLEGSCTFHAGDAEHAAAVGTFVFIPRGTLHRFDVGPTGARLLFWFTPAGPEGFFAEIVGLQRRDAPEEAWAELSRRFDVLPPEAETSAG